MADAKPIRFQYDPEAAIKEVEPMVPLDEYAFRRLSDLIVVYRNQLTDDDARLAKLTRIGDDWPAVKARLINEHGALYVAGGYIRSVRCDEILTGVERSIEQKRRAGRASAAKRQAKGNGALPAPVDVEPAQALPEPPATHVEGAPPDDAAPEPEPITLGPGRQGATISPDWRPGAEGVAFAVARGFTPSQIEAEVRGYVANCRDKGIISKDPDAGFKMWVLRSINSRPIPGVGKPMATAL